jgi:prevent-host-death family protein
MKYETLEMSASEFKAKCLELLDRVAGRKIMRITITKHGRPVAVLSPPALPEEEALSLFGFMRGRVSAPPEFDFTAPVIDEPLNAAEGRIYE